mmetsp:Transcript_14383/g.36725  ORF Transcript_14383/g.36725 Transcript_14383/m.36725 type:complete len:212 (+) Transcript_14383:849-1484(+)
MMAVRSVLPESRNEPEGGAQHAHTQSLCPTSVRHLRHCPPTSHTFSVLSLAPDTSRGPASVRKKVRHTTRRAWPRRRLVGVWCALPGCRAYTSTSPPASPTATTCASCETATADTSLPVERFKASLFVLTGRPAAATGWAGSSTNTRRSPAGEAHAIKVPQGDTLAMRARWPLRPSGCLTACTSQKCTAEDTGVASGGCRAGRHATSRLMR